MQTFSNWLLLERTFDRSFRDAAMQSYDKMKKVLVQGFTDAMNYSVNLAITRRKERGPDLDLYSRSLAAEITPRVGLGNKNPSIHVSLWNNDVTIYVSVTKSSGILVLPPQMTMKDFNRVFPQAKDTLFRLDLTSEMQSGVAGEYFTGREVTVTPSAQVPSFGSRSPKIAMYGNHALSFKSPDGDFYKCCHTITQLVLGGKTEREVKIIANEWLKRFDRSIEMGKYTYVHEYIHMLDDIRYKTKPGSIDASFPGNIKAGVQSRGTSEAYWKSDAEFNAHFQASAANIEDGIRSFLVASTSDFAGMNAAMKFKGFDLLNREHKCMRVSNYVEEDLYRVIVDNLKETWLTDAPKEFGLIPKGSPLFRLALGAITWYARGVSKHFLADEKLRMKLLNRIYSLSQELEGMIKEYKESMALGKIPSPQKFNQARAKFKPYGDPQRSVNTYALLYSGSMMGNLKVFDPDKDYEKS